MTTLFYRNESIQKQSYIKEFPEQRKFELSPPSIPDSVLMIGKSYKSSSKFFRQVQILPKNEKKKRLVIGTTFSLYQFMICLQVSFILV